MNITTVLNAMELAHILAKEYPNPRFDRQYTNIRDGILRRWFGMEYERNHYRNNAKFREQQAKETPDADAN